MSESPERPDDHSGSPIVKDHGMPASRVVSVRPSVYERLLALAGKLQMQRGQRVTLNDTISDLLDSADANSSKDTKK